MDLLASKTILKCFLIICLLLALVAEISDAKLWGNKRNRGNSNWNKGNSNWNKGNRNWNRGNTNWNKNRRGGGLPNRMVRGSSPFSSRTWRNAAMAGLIFGGWRYLYGSRHRYGSRHQQNKMPTICTNTDRPYSDENGTQYEYFICPLKNDTETTSYCCGPKKKEYCCDKEEAEKYHKNNYSMKTSTTTLIVTVIIFLVCCGLCLIPSLLKRNRNPNDSFPQSQTYPDYGGAYYPSPPPLQQMPQGRPGTSEANYPHPPPPYPGYSTYDGMMYSAGNYPTTPAPYPAGNYFGRQGTGADTTYKQL